LKSSTIVELKQNIYVQSLSHLFNSDSQILNHELIKEEIKQKSKFVFFELKVVPFNAETNTRDNFQDKNLFISAKNQRDLFYDILWHWEKNHKLENWNFADECGDKIRALISIKDNMTNFLQFVKLFQEQLVLICKDDKMLIDNSNDNLNGPENIIKSSYDPLKLKRLNARMSTPKPNYGPNPAPKFIGYQEFFKEFIDLSSSPIFHQCLKDSLIYEIETIHKEIPDLENNNSIDKDIVEDMLLKLRILGKFLGYLVFYAYQYSISSFSIKELIPIRNTSTMPLNLQLHIEKAIHKKHLILTIPFVVEFLSMMDEQAYQIDSIQHAISMLILIFKFLISNIKS
jgi:codanin-1